MHIKLPDGTPLTPSNSTDSPTDAGKSLLGNRKGGGDLDKAAGKTSGVSGDSTVATPDPDEKSSLRIHIKLDLDVEVHLTARVKVSRSTKSAIFIYLC